MNKLFQKTLVLTNIQESLDKEAEMRSACFIVMNDLQEGEILDLPEGEWILGRDLSCDIHLLSQGVSRKHLKIIVKDNVHIEDLKSSNGTFINKKKITELTSLSKGDQLNLGPALLKFIPKGDGERLNYEHLFKKSYIDDLTNVYNKNYFLKKFQLSTLLASEKNLPLTLAMLDLDFFKRLNDTYGHQAGDEVLKGFSAFLRDLIPFPIFRYGGEEFAIILNLNLKESKDLLEDLRLKMKEKSYVFQNEKFQVTFSAGLASLRMHQSAEELLAKADSALYSAKNNGRDQVREDSVAA